MRTKQPIIKKNKKKLAFFYPLRFSVLIFFSDIKKNSTIRSASELSNFVYAQRVHNLKIAQIQSGQSRSLTLLLYPLYLSVAKPLQHDLEFIITSFSIRSYNIIFKWIITVVQRIKRLLARF